MTYSEFLARKAIAHQPSGISSHVNLSGNLKPFQDHVTRWALRQGRAAIFADCGLGKSWMALEWARVIVEQTDKPVLILTPLAVAAQFIREGQKLGVDVASALLGTDKREWWAPAVWVANYESLHKIERLIPHLGGIVLDESSILKNFTGKTRNQLIETFNPVPYRLCLTATPSPNDPVELGNHAEFLGVMRHVDMLNRFFEHDAGDTGSWVLKGHARRPFWRWVSSWAMCLRKPSDIGFSDEGYDLPPLEMHEHVVDVDQRMARKAGMLFAFEATTLGEQREVRRASIEERVAKAAELTKDGEQWLVWAGLNDESTALVKAIPGAVEVTGSDSAELKEDAVMAFTGGMCLCHFLKKHGRSDVKRTSAGEMQTGSTSENTGEPSNQSSTPSSVPSTLPTRRLASTTGATPKNGRSEIPKANSLSISDGTESAWLDIELCSMSRAEGAQSAEPRQAAEPMSLAASTLTTATAPALSGGYSAPRATSESASLQTMQTDSSGPPCTCGGQSIRVIVTKVSIWGFGVNLQNCHNQCFVGADHSFESLYQAVRRSWRFGQQRPVHAHLIRTSADGAIVINMRRKQEEFERLHRELADAVNGRTT